MEVVILQRFLNTIYCLFVMQNKFVGSILLALMFVFSMNTIANEHSEVSGLTDKEKAKAEVKDGISHHLMDSYEFAITHGVSMPLPVILVDNGLQVFSGSSFHHGHDVVKRGDVEYFTFHSKIYKVVDNSVFLTQKKKREVVENGEKKMESYLDTVNVVGLSDFMHTYIAEAPFNKLDAGVYVGNPMPLDFSITKNVFMIMLMAMFMFFVFKGVSKSYQNQLPTGAGRFLEPLIIFVRDEIARPNIGEKHYKKYMSYLLTVFFFIWFLNLAGMMPFGINVTGNITITFSLALITFLITNFTAKKDYWGHIFWMPGVPKPMRIVLAPIELLGVLIKPFALMIRLYANMSAGHIVLMSLIGLIFMFGSWAATTPVLGLTLALSVLELLVAALQAYIFTMLTALYFGMAVEEHGDH